VGFHPGDDFSFDVAINGFVHQIACGLPEQLAAGPKHENRYNSGVSAVKVQAEISTPKA
jgi:hypothetical protein